MCWWNGKPRASFMMALQAMWRHGRMTGPGYFARAAIFFSRAAISRDSTSAGMGYGSIPL